MANIFAEEQDYDNGEDHISKLPDDILWTFLSPMELKEAAKTSILSKRWRYLWASQTHLDFNHLIIFPESDPNPRFDDFFSHDLEGVKSKYINWVNQVVDLHCGPCIDTFRVWFYFNGGDAHHIDKWFRFALSKKVERMELNSIPYKFEFTKPSLTVSDNGFTFLKSLYLNSINVSGDFLECLLSRSFLLERLYVGNSETLVRLKVFGSSCKLKHLTVRGCINLEELEIDAVNLIYFDCSTFHRTTNVELKSVPVLVEAAFGGRIVAGSIFQQISHVASQFSKLYLDLMGFGIPAFILPTFCNLKQLSLLVTDFECVFDIAAITNLLKACPVLQELKLEMFWMKHSLYKAAFELENDFKAEDVRQHWECFMEVEHMEQKTHPNLRTLQVVAFCGCKFDIDVILFLVVFACNLETIICDSSRDLLGEAEEIIEASKNRANKLAEIIPPKINVVII